MKIINAFVGLVLTSAATLGIGCNKNRDLEQMLAQLGSSEARATVVSRFVGKANIPKEYIEEAINFYENDNLGLFYPWEASHIARAAGMIERDRMSRKSRNIRRCCKGCQRSRNERQGKIL
jgi:hypothetical protein